jgi:hypothetical protein
VLVPENPAEEGFPDLFVELYKLLAWSCHLFPKERLFDVWGRMGARECAPGIR